MTQATALEIMKSGHNVFLTGGPGAGKTYVLNEYIEYLNDHGVEIAVTAPTGIAASHIGGMTLHSFFGVGIRESLSQYDIENLTEKKYLWDRMKNLKVLVIDEISMLSPELFASIDALLRAFKFSVKPFGGIQVILTGDFFQLPPVSKQVKEKRFAFQSEVWQDCKLSICYLDGSYRHEDETLLHILNEIREGEVSEDSMERFRGRYKKHPDIDGAITKLYTHNMDVDRINEEALAEIDEPLKVFEAHTTGAKKWIERMLASSLVLPTLKLKKGALVFFIKNDREGKYINGTLGTVVDFDTFGTPIIETFSGDMIKADRVEWSFQDDDGKILATIKQIPLRLAWAITIHKSQGMTLDAAEIDLSKAFEPGQGYVALSRIRSLDGLKLMGLNQTALAIDQYVLDADRGMREYSQELHMHFKNLDQGKKDLTIKQHMEHLGGTKERGAKKKTKKKEARSQTGQAKKSTYEKTLDLVKQEKTVSEIASERDMKEQTIFNHIEKIMELYPETDISYLQPPHRIIETVENAISDIEKRDDPLDRLENGNIKLRAIYEKLGEEISYEDIKLSLLFLG